MKMGTKKEWADQYILRGGKTFFIEKVDIYRDGGTRSIKTSLGHEYCVDKTLENLYYGYPKRDGSNKILDLSLQYYLLERLERYLKGLSYTINQTEELIEFLNEY